MRLSIRVDLANGGRIGPGKVALLEAIRDAGSISAGARKIGMSYRRAWLLVEEINEALREPAVATAAGGRKGGGALVTPTGLGIIALYREIEASAQSSAKKPFGAAKKLFRPGAAARERQR